MSILRNPATGPWRGSDKGGYGSLDNFWERPVKTSKSPSCLPSVSCSMGWLWDERLLSLEPFPSTATGNVTSSDFPSRLYSFASVPDYPNQFSDPGHRQPFDCGCRHRDTKNKVHNHPVIGFPAISHHVWLLRSFVSYRLAPSHQQKHKPILGQSALLDGC